MAYYLSRANRKILELFIPRLEEAQTDFFVELNKPSLLIDILKASKTQVDLKWISDKFKYNISDDGKSVEFKINQLVIKEFGILEEEMLDPRPMDFFSIANVILLEKPAHLAFMNSNITDEESFRLVTLADANGYTLVYKDDMWRIHKK